MRANSWLNLGIHIKNSDFVTFAKIALIKKHSNYSLEQLTAPLVLRWVNHLFKDPGEVQREPAERKDEDKAEDGFGHLPPLESKTADFPPLKMGWQNFV